MRVQLKVPMCTDALWCTLASRSKTKGTQTSCCKYPALTFHALGLVAL